MRRQLCEQRRAEVQTRRRRRDRAARAGVHRLIAFAIIGTVAPIDVWRKRHVPDRIDGRVEIAAVLGAKPKGPASKSLMRQNLACDPRASWLRPLQHDASADLQLLTGMHERIPAVIWSWFEQQHLDAPAARDATASQPRRKDLRVVHDEQVARDQPLGQVLHRRVRQPAGGSLEHEQT